MGAYGYGYSSFSNHEKLLMENEDHYDNGFAALVIVEKIKKSKAIKE